MFQEHQELFLNLFLIWIITQNIRVKTHNHLMFLFFQYIDMNHDLWYLIDHNTIYDFTWFIVDNLLWDYKPNKRIDRQENTYYSCESLRMNLLKVIFVNKKKNKTRPCNPY